MRGESSKEFLENIGSHVRMLVKIFLNIHTIFKSIVEETFRIRVQVSKKKTFHEKGSIQISIRSSIHFMQYLKMPTRQRIIHLECTQNFPKN